jgi:hypothetical protein
LSGRMRHPSGAKDRVSSFGSNLLLTDLKKVVAVNDVPPLILVMMNMKRYAAGTVIRIAAENRQGSVRVAS